MSLLVKNLSINDIYMDSPSTDPKPEDIIEDPVEEEDIEVWTVHVEVCVKQKATIRHDTIRKQVYNYLTTAFDRFYIPSVLQGWEDSSILASTVERITASECACPSASLSLKEISFDIHVYQPLDGEFFEGFDIGGSDDDPDTTAASMCELPSRNWDGLWDSLVYSGDIKTKLLEYIHATLVLSDANVDFNLVSWNRVILLHGPPGTGKTSLCRALAQKLSIRLSHRYPNSRLLEINSHSLFSRWFSESGKLVQRLFNSINELIDEEDTFVVVLIDEVESLTAARASAMAGTEPSDGLRVVNALLTQLDKLKHRKNVLIMSTSNLVKAIDSAFVDRADIVQFVDLPPREAVYEILRGALCEFIDKGVLAKIDIPTLAQAVFYEQLKEDASQPDSTQRSLRAGRRLLALSTTCKEKGLSGRALRRLPVLAFARYIGLGVKKRVRKGPLGSTTSPRGKGVLGSVTEAKREMGTDVEIWLSAMEQVVKDQSAEMEKVI